MSNDINPLKLLRGPSLCLAPWSHLYVGPSGSVYPCCVSKSPIGSLSTANLEQIWNSNSIREIRQSMLQGQKHQSCTQCYIEEDAGKPSYRTYINQKLVKRRDKIKQTNCDGSVDQFELNYLQFKFNNLCNLACRTCGPESSSAWHQIAVANNDIPMGTPALIDANDNGELFEEFKKHIEHVDLIKFTGGEPLIIKEFYDILDLLIAKDHTNVELFYNTNLTKLNYRGRSILDLWKKFPKVVVGASLDGAGQRGEYIRSLSKWPEVLENGLAIRKHCPNVYFFISATLNIINSLHLPDFHRYCVEQGLINAKDFDINLVHKPSYLSVINAPDDLKTKIKSKYTNHVQWLRDVDLTGRSISAFESVINLLDSPGQFDKDLFWLQAEKLDRYHNTDLLKTFPELSILPK